MQLHGATVGSDDGGCIAQILQCLRQDWKVEMLVSVAWTVPDDDGAHADDTAKDPEGGIRTTCGVCAESRRVASGARTSDRMIR